MAARVDGAYVSPMIQQERQTRVDNAYVSPMVKDVRQVTLYGVYVAVMIPVNPRKRRRGVIISDG